MQDVSKPRVIKYSALVPFRVGESIDATAVSFSNDSMFLACTTNCPAVGILIFEQFKGTLYQTITTDSIPSAISFHPTDSNKILVTGEQNLVKYWKFTSKSVHIAAVTGLKRGNNNYTAHGWIPPYAENTIAVGTNTGFVVTIQNCEQRAPVQYLFGSTDDGQIIGVNQILVRGDHVIVSSTKNMIVLFELRRVVLGKSYGGLTAVLVPLKYYRIMDLDKIYGLQFSFRDSITAYSMVACSNNCVSVLDIISDLDLSGAGMKKNEDFNDPQGLEWTDVVSKPLYYFHSGNIQSLSLASTSKLFLTSSFQDSTVRCWNYDEPSTFNSCSLLENYKDRPDENPFHVDLHPSGLHAAYACESEVREYAIADNQLDLIRKFGVRIPFQGPSGTPVVISQPVSLVRYSHGGHLIAVVTGKIAQVFHLYIQDNESSTVPGNLHSLFVLLHCHLLFRFIFRCSFESHGYVRSRQSYH
jgi:WD40 repeat protein